jgi:SAM-dependent methyltransferase
VADMLGDTAADRPTGDTAADRPTGDTAADRLARYYDLDLQDDPGDTGLYLAMAARTGGPILELAAGSGRLAVPLAAAGYHVTAVDNDPAMLRRAAAAWAVFRPRGRRRPSGDLELIEADLTALTLERRYGLAFIALNSLLLLDGPEAQRRAMGVLAAHLRPGGVAIVDIILPDASELRSYDSRIYLDWTRADPETNELVSKLASARHDAATATVTLTTLFDSVAAGGGPVHRTSRTDQLHLRNAADLVIDATDAGLQVELVAGDHQGTPFGPGSERIVLIAVSV